MTLNGIRIAISVGPQGVNPQVVRRIPGSIEQAYLRQPETLGDMGIEKVFSKGSEIPIQNCWVPRVCLLVAVVAAVW